MWEIIPKIGKPIALVAFALAVAFQLVRAYLNRRATLIKLAPARERAELIDRTFGIRAQGLKKDQQYELVLRALEQRPSQFRISAIVLVVIALIVASVIVVTVALN